VKVAVEMGAEVIILDHHECDELPNTPYILDPKNPQERYPFKHLCGAGVVYKLVEALMGTKKAQELIDIAGVATIGDIVSLTGENRVIAALGLKKLRENPNIGLKKLAECSGINLKTLRSHNVGFSIVPRINAAGRLEHASLAFDLLTTDDESEAEKLAGKLCEINVLRQDIQKNIYTLADEQVKEQCRLYEDRVLMIKGKGYSKGVIGLVASKLVENFNRPAVVFSEEDGKITGSARSIDKINIYEILSSKKELFDRFGGHAQAAGLTLSSKDFETLKKDVNEFARKSIDDAVFLRKFVYDVQIDVRDITIEFIEDLKKLEPFGEANPEPVFFITDAKIGTVRTMGKKAEHSRSVVNNSLNCVMFDGALLDHSSYMLAGTLSINDFNSRVRPELIIRSAQLKNVSKDSIKKENMRMFLAEALSFYEVLVNKEKYKVIEDEEKWGKQLAASVKKSPLGTLLIVNSDIGMDKLSRIKTDLPPICDTGVPLNSAENSVAITLKNAKAIRNYEDVFSLGAFHTVKYAKDANILLTGALIQKYIKQTEEFFVNEGQLKEYLSALIKLKTGYNTVTQLMQRACQDVKGGTLKKMWFAINVLCEQKLIGLKKYDKMHIKYFGRIQPQSSSRLYKVFTEILKLRK
jgi:single-stranded-DNA-specific exonuclease RecJ